MAGASLHETMGAGRLAGTLLGDMVERTLDELREHAESNPEALLAAASQSPSPWAQGVALELVHQAHPEVTRG